MGARPHSSSSPEDSIKQESSARSSGPAAGEPLLGLRPVGAGLLSRSSAQTQQLPVSSGLSTTPNLAPYDYPASPILLFSSGERSSTPAPTPRPAAVGATLGSPLFYSPGIPSQQPTGNYPVCVVPLHDTPTPHRCYLPGLPHAIQYDSELDSSIIRVPPRCTVPHWVVRLLPRELQREVFPKVSSCDYHIPPAVLTQILDATSSASLL